MSKMITIAIDAMGGDGSPKKIIDGINHHYKSTSHVFYKIYGDQEQISKFLPSTLNQKSFKTCLIDYLYEVKKDYIYVFKK